MDNPWYSAFAYNDEAQDIISDETWKSIDLAEKAMSDFDFYTSPQQAVITVTNTRKAQVITMTLLDRALLLGGQALDVDTRFGQDGD